VLRYRGQRLWLPAILIGVCIAVSAGKVAIIGVPLVAAFSCCLLPATRFQALRVTISIAACLAIYIFLFPGISTYTMSLKLIVSSLTIRLFDLLSGVFQLLGLQLNFGDFEIAVLSAIDKYTLSSSNAAIGSIGADWASRADMRTAYYDGGSMSMFAEALRHPFHTVTVIILVTWVALFNGKWMPAERVRSDSVMIFALTLFSMIANTSAAPLYWYWIGFGSHIIFGRAFNDTLRSSMNSSNLYVARSK
jgi:hypothetical protein